jgi:putative heme degradation protein
MIKRFNLPASEHSDSFARDCGTGEECKCCAAAWRAREQALFDPLPEWNSPLTPGIQLTNISHSDDGANLQVDLSRDWTRMFEQLPSIGSVLVMTRNAGAILGRRMIYPALMTTRGRAKAASCEGGLFIEFRNLERALAMHLRRETGHVFGVEFSDHSGKVIHRFTLTPASDMDEFFGWVRLHQVCRADRIAPLREEEGHAWHRERAFHWRECDGDTLTSIIAASADRAVPVRATVRSSAVTQIAEIKPLSLQPSDDWWFLSDDESGLHFHPGHFVQITLEQHVAEHGERRAVLRAVTEDGISTLLLEAAGRESEGAWRNVLETTV